MTTTEKTTKANPPNEVFAPHAHPMFLGRFLTESQVADLHRFMNPKSVPKNPTFFGSKPNEKYDRKHATVIDPKLVGAAEVYCETNHPIYAEIGAAMYERLPTSVMMNLNGARA